MKSMLKDAGILFVITLISGLVLGFIYDLTKEPIAAQEAQKTQAAYQEVLPDAADFEVIYDTEGNAAGQITREQIDGIIAGSGADADIESIVSAKDAGGAVIGYILMVTDHEGYGGDITFAMGIKNADQQLNGASILSISETAGLGMRAGEVIVPQLPGKDMKEDITYTKAGDAQGNQIDAISGATVTTTAFVNGLNAGRAVYAQLLAE
ncbi:MAG: RnfABCDGE type electron transport complex subunit G [Lachnospiraceae bacterium]|nr:RnfABCDGE type electron transport complex subunit G [Lachnospiraceae bacterium]